MARTINQPSAATRRTGGGQPAPGARGQRNQDGQLDDDERREGPTATRDERDDERNDSRESRDERENGNDRNDRQFGENRDRGGQGQRGGYTEQSSPPQRPAMSAGVGTFAPVLEAWTQVFKAWSEITETMVKAQQEAFASIISTANATATDSTLDDHRSDDRALSGARTTASTPDRIEHDRR